MCVSLPRKEARYHNAATHGSACGSGSPSRFSTNSAYPVCPSFDEAEPAPTAVSSVTPPLIVGPPQREVKECWDLETRRGPSSSSSSSSELSCGGCEDVWVERLPLLLRPAPLRTTPPVSGLSLSDRVVWISKISVSPIPSTSYLSSLPFNSFPFSQRAESATAGRCLRRRRQ